MRTSEESNEAVRTQTADSLTIPITYTNPTGQTVYVNRCQEPDLPSRLEAAAGSRYVEVPVAIRAETTDGRTQRFQGTYTLRRSVVDGATAE